MFLIVDLEEELDLNQGNLLLFLIQEICRRAREESSAATLRNPYNPDETLPSAYSTTSNILNIDTHTLARLDGRNAKYFGFARGGMIIKGLKSGAVCKS